MGCEVNQERGELDDPEVYARIYMDSWSCCHPHVCKQFSFLCRTFVRMQHEDKIIPQMNFAVWLDADTIVQKDVKELQTRLQQSGKTIGFVSRSTKMYPDFLTGKCAPELDVSWNKLKNLTAYNTGAESRGFGKLGISSFLV